MRIKNPKLLRLAALGLLTLAGVIVLELGGPAAKFAQTPGSADIAALQRSFQNPPGDSKIMVRWWWFSPAVTTEELNREMHEMKDAGIGGFEVQPVYPLTLDDPAKGLVNLRYLSPEFLKAVSDVARTASELGLRMDMTMGSGWPFGEPLPDRKQLTAKYGERFVDQGNNLIEALPSGLLGPIRLIPRIQIPTIKVSP